MTTTPDVRPLQTVVILVTDLVGSTALGSRLGSARFGDFRHEHDSILRDAAEDVEGHVVKHTGDGLLVAFPSVGGALDGAVSMQQRLERRNRGAEVKMDVRIGISMGDVAIEDGDYFGIAPIEASRLCAEAGGGGILVADPVRAVLRGNCAHALEPAGALSLKGLPEPVVAWKVLWTALPEFGGPPLPPRLRGASQSVYVGRAPERRVLLECWDRAVGGQRQVVVIAGEPGIGKTRLVTETAQTALPDHAVVLYGRCDEDHGVPYLPWREVLRDYVEIAPRRLLRPHASELSRLVPGLSQKLGTASAPPSTDPATERYLLFGAVQALLRAASELAPLMIILDDLHWADRPTLLLLEHLITSSTTGRLMILGTVRDSDIPQDEQMTPLLADLYREPGVTRVGLVGLEEEDIVDLIEELAGHSVDQTGLAMAREVHRETAGNPFFVGELLRHLAETGVIDRQRDGRWSFTSSLAGHGLLPQSVREVIGRRVQRLSPDALQILTVGAVIGGEFDLALVAHAAERSAPRVLDLLDEAIAASLLDRTTITPASFVGPPLAEVYTFSHGLVQATLYDNLPPGRRATLHKAVGEAMVAQSLGRVEAKLAEIAHHFLAAAPAGDVRRAIDYAIRAAEHAMSEFAYDQAAALFAQTLAIAGGEPGSTQIALLQGLGDAQMRAGDSEAARRTLLKATEAARRHDEPEALARAVRSCGIWGLSLGVDEVLIGLAEEAIESLEGRGSRRLLAEIKGLLAAALYYAPISQAPRRERLAAEALAAARMEHARADDRESKQTLAYVLGRYLLAVWGPDSAVRDFELAEELVELCRELGDVELEMFALNWRNTMLGELGRFAELERELAEMEQMVVELRQPRAMVFLPLHRAMLAFTAGRFAEAERLNAESVEIGRRIVGSVSSLAADAQMVMLRLQQGRLPEIEAQVRAVTAAYPDMAAFQSALVVLLLQASREDEARVEFERAIGPGTAAVPRNYTYILTLALLAEAAAELGDEARARALYEALAPYTRRWVVAANDTVLWPVDRSLGRLAGATGQVDVALSHLVSARLQAEHADALPSLALIALDEARALAGRGVPGDAERASLRAREARNLAESLGMPRVAAQAQQLRADLAAASTPGTRAGDAAD